MNMTQKFSASVLAVAAVSAVLFTSANAVSIKPAPVQVAAAPAATNIVPANSPETPASELSDKQYN